MACTADNYTASATTMDTGSVVYYVEVPRRTYAYAYDDESRMRRAAQRAALLVLLSVVLPADETLTPPGEIRESPGRKSALNGAAKYWPLWSTPPPRACGQA